MENLVYEIFIVLNQIFNIYPNIETFERILLPEKVFTEIVLNPKN